LPGDPSDFTERAFHDDTEAHPVTIVEPVALPPTRRKDADETHDAETIAPAPDVPPSPKPSALKPESKAVVEMPKVAVAPAPVVQPPQTVTVFAPPADEAPPLITEIDNPGNYAGSTKAHGGP
jgi:hypothetical protein